MEYRTDEARSRQQAACITGMMIVALSLANIYWPLASLLMAVSAVWVYYFDRTLHSGEILLYRDLLRYKDHLMDIRVPYRSISRLDLRREPRRVRTRYGTITLSDFLIILDGERFELAIIPVKLSDDELRSIIRWIIKRSRRVTFNQHAQELMGKSPFNPRWLRYGKCSRIRHKARNNRPAKRA